MSTVAACRVVAALLWLLAAYDSVVCRGLFWDGAAFLVNIVDLRAFHDFYPARAHVGWVTQLPVLIAVDLGVVNMKVLAMVQSVALFALPVGLYHLALARVRHEPLLLAVVAAAIALVYLPTSFFIIGEYNALYAAATAAMAIVLTGGHDRLRDGLMLCALAVLSVRSYEAMVYFGPLLAAASLWWAHSAPAGDRATRALGVIAAAGFLGGALVSGATIFEYWHHPHFTLVRAAILDFWQNQQFIVPLVGLALFAVATLASPTWLRTPAPIVLIVTVAGLLAAMPWSRHWLGPDAMIFPPAHYVARTAAGCLLWALLIVMWAIVVWRRRAPKALDVLREKIVGRRLATAMVFVVVGAAVPDLALTRLWTDYVTYFRGLTAGRPANIAAHDLPNREWPYGLFSQEWTAPALSAVLRMAPADGIVLGPQGPKDTMPFDARCGTLPHLAGYSWRD